MANGTFRSDPPDPRKRRYEAIEAKYETRQPRWRVKRENNIARGDRERAAAAKDAEKWIATIRRRRETTDAKVSK